MKRGAVILCGGHSSRMGVPKLDLPFGPETMLQRILRRLAEVCPVRVVVAARDQVLPPLEAGVIVARDRRSDRGPLEGLLAGLTALPAEVEAAYVTSCDVPRLVGAFVLRMFDLLGDHAAAVPVVGGYLHPLAAVYRPGVSGVVEELLDAQQLRPSLLLEIVSTRRVEPAELTDVDPHLHTLENLNRPEDYLRALAECGFAAPEEVRALLAAAQSEPPAGKP